MATKTEESFWLFYITEWQSKRKIICRKKTSMEKVQLLGSFSAIYAAGNRYAQNAVAAQANLVSHVGRMTS